MVFCMKALVTGGAGFIGSHVAEALLAKGFSVAVADNFSTGKKENLSAVIPNPNLSLNQVDITDSSQLMQVFAKEKPEIVFHLAAQVNARIALADPLLDARINILGSINVLEAGCKNGVKKIVYSSSCAAYGHPKQNPVNEMHVLEPVLTYGVSKLAVEYYLETYRKLYGLDYIALRYANVYGPRQNGVGEGGVIAVFTEKAIGGQPLLVYGDGEQTRDFVFVQDVAAANLAAATALGNPLGIGARIINIGSGRETSINQLVAVLSRILKSNLKISRGAPIPEVRQICLDTGLAKKELQWMPSTTLEVGLAKTVDWARTRPRSGN